MAREYQRRSADDWNRRANQSGSDFKGFAKNEYQTYKPKKGLNTFRILPPSWDDAPHYGLDIYVHYGVGPDKASVLCLNRMKGEKCPVCEARARAERLHDEQAMQDLKPTKRVLAWVVDRDEPAKPMLYAMSWTIDKEIAGLSVDPRTKKVLNIDDPDEGYDVSFRREGEGMKVKYSGIQIDREPSEIEDEYLDYIEAHPIPETLIWRTYEEIQELFQGGVEPVEAISEEDRPRTRLRTRQAPEEREPEASRPATRRRLEATTEPADDAPPFDVEPQTPVEEERPRRATRTSSPAVEAEVIAVEERLSNASSAADKLRKRMAAR